MNHSGSTIYRQPSTANRQPPTILVLPNLLETRYQPFDQGGTETLMLHFIQNRYGTTLGCGYLIYLLLRMGLFFQQEFSSTFYGLCCNQAGSRRVKANFNTPLNISTDIPHGKGGSAGAQNSSRIHEFFINFYSTAQLTEHFQYFLKGLRSHIPRSEAGHAFAYRDGRVGHGPDDRNIFRNQGR